MNDTNRLYFIPILAHALKAGDRGGSLKRALMEIRNLGQRPEYQEGFRNFRQFLRAAIGPGKETLKEIADRTRDAVYALIYDLASGEFQGDESDRKTALEAIESNPHWRLEYERVLAETRLFLADEGPLKIEFLRGNELLRALSVPLEEETLGASVPGTYTLRLSNGRILWQGELRKEDLLWTYAYPDEDLPMAAETEGVEQAPKRVISVLAGELSLRVFPGLESGEIRLRNERPR